MKKLFYSKFEDIAGYAQMYSPTLYPEKVIHTASIYDPLRGVIFYRDIPDDGSDLSEEKVWEGEVQEMKDEETPVYYDKDHNRTDVYKEMIYCKFVTYRKGEPIKERFEEYE